MMEWMLKEEKRKKISREEDLKKGRVSEFLKWEKVIVEKVKEKIFKNIETVQRKWHEINPTRLKQRRKSYQQRNARKQNWKVIKDGWLFISIY